MSASPLAEFDDLIQAADPQRRARAVRQIGRLFREGAPRFNSTHVQLFDGVLAALSPSVDIAARADLAELLAPIDNAPPVLISQLVRDSEACIAGPLLRLSPLIDEPTLIEVARAMGQDHLRAISERRDIAGPVTDVLVRRGDRAVVRSLAANQTAEFSEQGYSGLIKRAQNDGVLAIAIGQRDALPDAVLRQLLDGSVDVVRRRLFDTATSARKTAIAQAMVMISQEKAAPRPALDFTQAQAEVVALHRSGGLNKDALLRFARERKYEQTVALLAAISALPLAAIDKIISDSRRDSLLVLGRSLGLDWQTVRAVLALRFVNGGAHSVADLETARSNFEHLSPTTAQRVVKFWKDRPPM